MIVEMGCLVLGVPVGFLLRRKPLAIKITDQVLTWSVRILLLLLGLALGADDSLMSQMDTIGARGIFISLCCVAGSLIGARLLEPVMNRHVGHLGAGSTSCPPDGSALSTRPATSPYTPCSPPWA